MTILKKVYSFVLYNEHKGMTLQGLVLSAYFRFQMLYTDSQKLNQRWGIEGEESSENVTADEYRYAKKVSYVVNRVCEKTKWESKCLVRALTAQHMLAKKKIESTLYLGIGYDEQHKMIAHAWLRCGQMYVTGGSGEQMTKVDCFRSKGCK